MGAVIEAQAALDWLHHRYFSQAPDHGKAHGKPTGAMGQALPGDAGLLEKIRRSKTGPEFDRLWSGDAGQDASGADFRLCSILAFWTGKDARRMDDLFRQSGLFQNEGRAAKWDRKHHADGRTYGQATVDKAIEATRETYHGGAGGMPPAAGRPEGRRSPPSQGGQEADPQGWPEPLRGERPVTPCGDVANAQRIHRHHGANLLYVPGMGWLSWRGDHWQLDHMEALRCALGLGQIIAGEASDLARAAAELDPEGKRFLKDEPDGAEAKKAKTLQGQADALRNWAAKVERDGARIPRALGFAQAYLSRPASTLDANGWLLPCVNGTLDLKNGQLRGHRRADFCTGALRVPYEPGAKAPTWERFLREVFDGNEALIAYIQRAAGYCLTGDVREHVLFILWGGGANGKSTFLNALAAVLGLFMRPAAPGLLMASQGERHPADIADIRGARLVTAVENAEGKSFDEERMKWLTGGDKLKARHMRQDFIEFDPTAKFWLATNHKPMVRGADHGVWRRIHLIPFTVTFPPEKRDATLPAKLEAEAPGILAWLVEGCREWQRAGLAPPAEVLAATEEYRSEMDTIGQFVAERLVKDFRATVAGKDVYDAYRGWCEENGLRAASQQALGRKLAERGIDRIHTMRGKVYQGWRLRAMTDMTNMTLFPDDGPEDPHASTQPENAEIGHIGHSHPMTDMTDMKHFPYDGLESSLAERQPENAEIGHISHPHLVQCLGCSHWGGACAKGVKVTDPAILRTCEAWGG